MNKEIGLPLVILILFLNLSCKKDEYKATFKAKLEQLQPIEGLEVLKSEASMIAVSGVYQGRVFASSSKGMNGKAYGWFNNSLIEDNTHQNTMASLGGESRIWLAPQFGKFAIFFDEGVAQTDDNIRTPKDLDNLKFKEVSRTNHSITYKGEMQIKNDHNYAFAIGLNRTIAILTKQQIEDNLSINMGNTSYVAFSAETTMMNIGNQQWNKETGLLSLWELSCMSTNADNKVIIPLTRHTDSITQYFTKTTQDRMQIKNGVVYYKADANGLNKIGTLPEHTKSIMGSYSKESNLLNIVTFSFPNDGVFVNSLPDNSAPYRGDVINIFNGNVDEELGHKWPFYEFESSSVAKELKPEESIYHLQTTYHFEGDFEALDEIARKVLGVSLNDIPQF